MLKIDIKEEKIENNFPKKEEEMHTFNETGPGVPAFLAKLWRLVEDPETNNLICWTKDGRSFIIQNQAQFARELLPLNYKHNNMASFIRQLNMYGFHKITSIDNGGLKFDRDEMEFTHPCFKRNCPYLLEHIKRKIASTKSVDEKSALKTETVTKVLQDVKAMRGRQDSLDSRFSVMKQENEALWREIASLRQKHSKQQQIVNKLIQFLITIVQPQRNMTSVKRNIQLMINDTPDKTKMRKKSESDVVSGPVIHELGDVSEAESESIGPNSPFIQVTAPSELTTDPDNELSPHNIERPLSSVSMTSQSFDFSDQSAEDSGDYLSAEAAAGAAARNGGIIQAINNDGSKIFYHISEVPDAHPQEQKTSSVNYNDDNVLTTPMVREQMARNQLLKQKNRLRRFKIIGPSNAKLQRVASEHQTAAKQQADVAAQQVPPKPIQIKSEQDTAIDHMLFLNAYPNDRVLTPEPNLISPNFSEDSRQSNSNNTAGSFLINSSTSANSASPIENDFLTGNVTDLYNPSSFIANDIPADIFEDNSLPSEDIEENNNLKKAQQHLFAPVNSGELASFLSESTPENGGLQASTSAAAAAAAISSTNNGINNNNDIEKTTSTAALKNGNGSNLALTKYNNNSPDFLRNDVSGHLNSVQDELDGLKDLLRSDVYSLDQNSLLGMSLNEIINSKRNSKLNTNELNKHQIFSPPSMEEDILNKLFNDSDILGPYGLQLSNDGSNSSDKKELTYQPVYDLSDIINDQNDLVDGTDVNIPTTSTLETQQPSQPKQQFINSVLNTPCHE